MNSRKRILTERRHIEIDGFSIVALVTVFAGLIAFAAGLTQAIHAVGGFSFGSSFFSELGQTGRDSAVYFNSAVVALGVCVLVFFLNFLRYANGIAFGLLGAVSSLGLIGIGLTPMDTHLVPHLMCLGIWLLAMLSMLILQSIQSLIVGQYTAPIIAGTLGMLIVAYGTSGMGGEAPFYQKLVVAGAIVWLAHLCWLVMRNAFVIVCERVGGVGHDDKTKAYIDRLESSGMYGEHGRRGGDR